MESPQQAKKSKRDEEKEVEEGGEKDQLGGAAAERGADGGTGGGESGEFGQDSVRPGAGEQIRHTPAPTSSSAAWPTWQQYGPAVGARPGWQPTTAWSNATRTAWNPANHLSEEPAWNGNNPNAEVMDHAFKFAKYLEFCKIEPLLALVPKKL